MKRIFAVVFIVGFLMLLVSSAYAQIILPFAMSVYPTHPMAGESITFYFKSVPYSLNGG